MMRQHAIVTGANGLIGRRLVEALIDRGVSTVAVDCTEGAHGCPFRQLNLTIPGALDELLTNESMVFHLAAKTSVSGSVASPRDDFEVNVAGTIEVLESARRTGAAVVFASSSATYDPRSPLPHNEKSPKRPISPYGAAKLASEGYCSVYHHCYSLDVRVVRLFNVYGPGMKRFAIHDFFHKINQAEDTFEVLGDGKQVRDFLYLDDAVNGFVAVSEHGQPGEDYNVASGEPTRIIDLAKQMCDTMGRSELIIKTTGKSFPGDVPEWYADISKIQSIGFCPRIPLESGLQNTVNWLNTTV